MKEPDALACLHVDFPVALELQVMEVCLAIPDVMRFELSGARAPPTCREANPIDPEAWQRRLRIVAHVDVCARVAGALHDTLLNREADFRIEKYRHAVSM